MNEKIFTVEGMSCKGCSSGVEKAVGAVPGVEKAVVSLEEKRLTVVCDDSVTGEAVKASVEEAGFDCKEEV